MTVLTRKQDIKTVAIRHVGSSEQTTRKPCWIKPTRQCGDETIFICQFRCFRVILLAVGKHFYISQDDLRISLLRKEVTIFIDTELTGVSHKML